MKIFVSLLNVPIGYVTPRFPLLYWPLGPTHGLYEQLFLYYLGDIWRFTVYWLLICFSAAYAAVGLCAAASVLCKARLHAQLAGVRRLAVRGLLLVLALYLFSGAAQGFLTGAVVGLVLQAIYLAGLLSMSTWIPFSWGLAEIVYHICSSYSTSSLLI